MKVKTKQLMFKLSGKFDWQSLDSGRLYWRVILPDPRNIEYRIVKRYDNQYILDLYRLKDRYGRGHDTDLHLGSYPSLQEAQTRAELREARYEVKKATRERKLAGESGKEI